jgi:CAAX prenyl protease N-terminal, five membrane helices
MHWFTIVFVAILVAGTLVRSWLNQRQIAAVQRNRERVPEAFADQIDIEAHRKAADYTSALGHLGRWDNLLDAAIALFLTLGGGITAIDALWRGAGWSEAWHGTAVVLSTILLMSAISLPLSLYRTFGIDDRRLVRCRFTQRPGRQPGSWRALDLRRPILDATCRFAVVAVRVVRLGRLYRIHHVGVADLHCATLQQVHTAFG